MKKPTQVTAALLGAAVAVQYVVSPYAAYAGGEQPQDLPKASLALTLSSTAGFSGSPSRLVFDAISDADVVILPAIGSLSITERST
jgi:hypothetical protein